MAKKNSLHDPDKETIPPQCLTDRTVNVNTRAYMNTAQEESSRVVDEPESDQQTLINNR